MTVNTEGNVYAAVIGTAVDTIVRETAEYNELSAKVAHAGDAFQHVYAVRDELPTEDENILKYRAWLEGAMAKIEENKENIKNYILSAGLVDTSPIDVPAVTEQAKAKGAVIKSLVNTLNTLKDLAGGTVIPELPTVNWIKGARQGGTQGASGIWRPRFTSITVDGVDIHEMKGDKKVSTTGVLMAYLGKEGYVSATGDEITTSFLQDHVLSAADGKKDLSVRKGAPIEVSLAVLRPGATDGAPAEEVTLDLLFTPSS